MISPQYRPLLPVADPLFPAVAYEPVIKLLNVMETVADAVADRAAIIASVVIFCFMECM